MTVKLIMSTEDKATPANKRRTKNVNQKYKSECEKCYPISLMLYLCVDTNCLLAKLFTYNVEPALICLLKTLQLLIKMLG